MLAVRKENFPYQVLGGITPINASRDNYTQEVAQFYEPGQSLFNTMIPAVHHRDDHLLPQNGLEMV